jgi:hypothetical protein
LEECCFCSIEIEIDLEKECNNTKTRTSWQFLWLSQKRPVKSDLLKFSLFTSPHTVIRPHHTTLSVNFQIRSVASFPLIHELIALDFADQLSADLITFHKRSHRWITKKLFVWTFSLTSPPVHRSLPTDPF